VAKNLLEKLRAHGLVDIQYGSLLPNSRCRGAFGRFGTVKHGRARKKNKQLQFVDVSDALGTGVVDKESSFELALLRFSFCVSVHGSQAVRVCTRGAAERSKEIYRRDTTGAGSGRVILSFPKKVNRVFRSFSITTTVLNLDL